ncbi:ABC transporter F family member 4 [Hibiscus syriacus]|uniref:ABC transporter F family member 4 n=1 Tax=Hibiscus syriacus TaxID=106335 RepID=A0A6A2ZME9_HIBSY|nr:ABC transporter F family member 4 [Hibiscus syriacus]
MGKKKQEDSGVTAKVKGSGKDVKKKRLSVSAMLASMDQKPDKQKKAVPSFSSTSAKPKAKGPKVSSYTDGIDLPTKQEALRDVHDAFTVVIGSRASVLHGDDEADANVRDITIDNFSVSARGKELLKNALVKISHGRRYGLVGPNGMGKSTLLKLLAWRKIPVLKNIDVLLVEQEVVGDDRTALQAVVSANEELLRVREEVAALKNSFSPGREDDNAAEAQASKILAGLGFTKEMQGRPTRSFSGGWRMRISLARALFVQPTLLLLDEPTNHLDLRAVLWLEYYLYRCKKTLVVVSHDRDFLNTVCTEIIHLHDFKVQFYRGNFDDFESGYEQRRKEMNKKFEIYEKQIKAAKRSENRVQQEKGKRSGKIINVSFSYPNQEDFRLSDVDLGIDMGTRVAIVGPNGAGKSTLLNLIAGDLVPTEGEVRRSQKLRIGRYSQHFVDLLTMEETPVQYLLRLNPDQEGLSKQEAVRAKLRKFGLPSHNHLTPTAKLSGGQKARVVYTSISMSKPHILLLDEPTNHLDMQSIDALADALDEFTGGVVLVSHDSRLISRVCKDEEKSQIWVVDNG